MHEWRIFMKGLHFSKFKVVILVCFQILGESAACKDGAGATATSDPEDGGDGDISTMDPEPEVVNRGSQCNIRCLHSSLAVQVKPQIVDVGTQTERFEHCRSTRLASPEQSDDEWSFSDIINHSGDMSWSPGEEMLSEFSEEEPEELESLSDPNAIDKFIVCQRQLLSLFTACPACCRETQGHIMHPEATFIKVKQVMSYLSTVYEELNYSL
ncbi:uncharacterized protein LOC132097008 [Carassius carassius]|uniref:uncharacterized protein LOC132097008 n=1 Tax=Carassius carassius TaxID=217509 RepID=UPI00286863E8|nr:uncharacterized protein LOC132097008 [Carassius carassius]